jgi:hypothetical protein
VTPIAAIALPMPIEPGIVVPAPTVPFDGLLAAATLAPPLAETVPVLAPAAEAPADLPLEPTPEALLLAAATSAVPVQPQPQATLAKPSHPEPVVNKLLSLGELDNDPDAEDDPVLVVSADPQLLQVLRPAAAAPAPTIPFEAIQPAAQPALLPILSPPPSSRSATSVAGPIAALPMPRAASALIQTPPASPNSKPAADFPTQATPTIVPPADLTLSPNPGIAVSPPPSAVDAPLVPAAVVALPAPPATAVPFAPLPSSIALTESKPLPTRSAAPVIPIRRRDPAIATQLTAPAVYTPAALTPDRQATPGEPRLAPTPESTNPAPVDATVRAHVANAIELATDRLGAVRLAFDASDTAVRVHVTADRPATASLIVAQADRLQAAVETGGTRLSGLSVDVRDGGDNRRQLPWQTPGQDHPVPQPRRASPSEITRPTRQDRFA